MSGQMVNSYQGYRAAQSGAVAIDRSAAGRFEMLDRDRLDLLNRMSTNAIADLKHGQGQATLLTTALARMIDRLIVYERGDRTLIVCGAGRVKTVRGWLQKHIFFQDKVQTRDVSAETCQFGLFGVQAEAIAAQLAGTSPDAIAALARHHFVETTIGDTPILLARTYALAGSGFMLIGPAAARERIQAALQESGALAADENTYDMLRIEAMLPAEPELSEAYLPPEAGLWQEIDFKKGCYIGQEIIARMESRHKLARTLARFTSVAWLPPQTPLRSGEREVGLITSVAQYPDGQFQALGYIRVETAGPALLAVPGSGAPVTVSMVESVGWSVER